jgi:hypothetical protein
MNDPAYFLVVACACAVLFDAKWIGVKKGLVRGIANLAPWVWFCGCLTLWPIVFPLYVLNRADLKRAAERWRRFEHCAPMAGPRCD